MVLNFSSTHEEKQSKVDLAHVQDNPKSKTGAALSSGLHPTDMEGQEKLLQQLMPKCHSEWADNIYSRKFGDIHAIDDSHGDGGSESAPKKRRLIPAFLQAFQPPKQNDSKKRDDDNRNGDNDDRESEKTLILGAD